MSNQLREGPLSDSGANFFLVNLCSTQSLRQSLDFMVGSCEAQAIVWGLTDADLRTLFFRKCVVGNFVSTVGLNDSVKIGRLGTFGRLDMSQKRAE